MGGWRCGGCDGENPDGTRFCGWCGVERSLDTQPDRPEERRLVTALFADISGFTTLSEQLDDPEELHEVIAPVISGLLPASAGAMRMNGTSLRDTPAHKIIETGIGQGLLETNDTPLTVMSLTAIVCFLTAGREAMPLFLDGRLPDTTEFKAHLFGLLFEGLRKR